MVVPTLRCDSEGVYDRNRLFVFCCCCCLLTFLRLLWSVMRRFFFWGYVFVNGWRKIFFYFFISLLLFFAKTERLVILRHYRLALIVLAVQTDLLRSYLSHLLAFRWFPKAPSSCRVPTNSKTYDQTHISRPHPCYPVNTLPGIWLSFNSRAHNGPSAPRHKLLPRR